MNFLQKLFSEADNETPCPVRIAAGITNFGYHLGAAVGIYMGAIHLDIVTIGLYIQHMVTLIGVGGLSIGTKSLMKGDAS